MRIRAIEALDKDAWLAMRVDLWPDSDPLDAEAWLERDDAVTLLAFNNENVAVEFAEAGERDYADGCDTSPVAFLEGWYVVPGHRNQSIGRELVNAVEEWARARGLTEFASDALLEDEAAIRSHIGIGFDEVERSVKFRKPLS